jgi:hypothetical protein
MRSSELFDLGYVQEQVAGTHLQDADESTLCQALATDRSLFATSPSPLFDPAFYQERYPDIAGYGAHPFVHFIMHGFYEARRPHPLLDPLYLWSGTQHAGQKLDTPDDLPAALRAADPHPLFHNRYVRETYGSAVDGFRCPLEFYLRADEPRIKQASIWFSPGEYLNEHPEVAKASRDALVDMVTRGAKIGIDLRLVRGVLSAHGFRPDAYSGPLPWPTDASGYLKIADVPDPELTGPLPSRSQITVGVVLFRTDRTELDRLVRAVASEVTALAGRTDATVTLHLAVNDERAADYQEWLESTGHEPLAVKVLDSGSNVGFGRAHNVLMSAAFAEGADHYVGLNPDGYLMSGSLENLLRLTTALSDTALIEADAFPVGHPKWFDPVSFDTEWVSGAAFLMPRRIHDAVGGFDERFFMYCEDVDLSWRVREAGFRTVVCPTAPFYHDVAPRLGTVDREATKAMFLSGRLLGHKWGSRTFVQHMEDVLARDGLLDRADLPALPPVPPVDSEIPNFDYDLRFAMSRYW